MKQLFQGETVTVHWRTDSGEVDWGGNPVYIDVVEEVENVLVASGPRSDVDGSTRPDGVKVAWNLHFPKTFHGDLTGARVSVRGEPPCYVIGSPRPYTAANTPTSWNLPVELEVVNG